MRINVCKMWSWWRVLRTYWDLREHKRQPSTRAIPGFNCYFIMKPWSWICSRGCSQYTDIQAQTETKLLEHRIFLNPLSVWQTSRSMTAEPGYRLHCIEKAAQTHTCISIPTTRIKTIPQQLNENTFSARRHNVFIVLTKIGWVSYVDCKNMENICSSWICSTVELKLLIYWGIRNQRNIDRINYFPMIQGHSK